MARLGLGGVVGDVPEEFFFPDILGGDVAAGCQDTYVCKHRGMQPGDTGTYLCMGGVT